MKDVKNILIGILSLLVVILFVIVIFQSKSRSNEASYTQIDPMLVPITDEKAKREPRTPYEIYQVRNTLTKKNYMIRDCYLKFTETNPERREGRIKVDWQIAPSGKVITAEVVYSQINDPLLDGCIINSIKSWEFPPPPSDRPVYTSFEFTFKDEASEEENKEGKPTSKKKTDK